MKLAAALPVLALALAHPALAAPAVIYDMGGKFDKSFNEAAYRGIEQWRKETMIERLKTLFQNDVDVDSTSLLAGYHVNNPPDEVC